MNIKFIEHAEIRMKERGASSKETLLTIESGEKFTAKFNRVGYRRNFSFSKTWKGIYYNTKQVEAYTVQEGDDLIIVTVIVKYFQTIKWRQKLEISYDKKYNIAYIKIQEKTSKVETITLSDEIDIDISPDGKIYGIELLNANDYLKSQDNELVFTDMVTGKKIKIPIGIN